MSQLYQAARRLGRRPAPGTLRAGGMRQRLACVKRTGHGAAIWAFSCRAASTAASGEPAFVTTENARLMLRS